MRVVTYNILDGGEGRADPLAEVLIAQQPDVVTLIEADVPAVVQRIAGRLGMDFITGHGNYHSVAILSRWPIGKTVNHALLTPGISRCFLEAEIAPPGADPLPVAAIHLPAGATDADEALRLKEVAVVLNLLRGHRDAGRPHLLCGDFNSTAEYHRMDPANLKAKTRQAWAKNGNRLPTQVVSAVLAAGYLDTMPAAEPGRFLGSFDTQTPGQRVDYVFAFGFGRSTIGAAWVEQDRLAKYASDHFPVGAEINR